MPYVADALRPLWLPTINAVTTTPSSTLADWLNKGEYFMHTPVAAKTSFRVVAKDRTELLKAFAYDLDRLAAAAFESLFLAQQSEILPRSTGWPFIKSYYSAFFAAHALMRLWGTSCTLIEDGVANTITTVAKLYGNDNGFSVSSGTYRCDFDFHKGELICNQISGGGGSHEAVWNVFVERLRGANSLVLRGGISQNTHPVWAKLDALAEALTQGRTYAGWLSGMRNRVNYKHSLGSWFPYVDSCRHDRTLFGRNRLWLADPLDISVEKQGDADIVFAQRVCQFITALCRIEVLDLLSRCPAGRSFCDGGSIALLRQASPRPARAARRLARYAVSA